MKILFFVSQYCTGNLKLQPWLTIHRTGRKFRDLGHQVHIATDSMTADSEDFCLHRLKSLRGSNSLRIKNIIKEITPDKIIVSVSPTSLITAGWYELFRNHDTYAFMSNAFYNKREFIRAIRHLSLRDIVTFGGQVAVPEIFWAERLKSLFKGIICQSVNTAERLEKALKSAVSVYHIPPGIDIDDWHYIKKTENSTQQSIFLYTGSATKIRGFNLILKAFSKIHDPDIALMILARNAGEGQLDILKKQVRKYGVKCTVDIIGGWVSQKALKDYIYNARAVLLPFILVPSELPVTVMESIACGTPVIVSRIDGLPGSAGSAGLVIPHGNVDALVTAVERLHIDERLYNELTKSCNSVRESMMSWETVSLEWLRALEN